MTRTICNKFEYLPEATSGHDEINHPAHYTSSNATCDHCGKRIEAIMVTRHLDNNVGNAVKYLWRFKDKGGVKDLKKAQWYLADEIKRQEGLTRNA